MLICITGKLGVGKTTALNILKSQRFITLAMDDFIHEIYQKNNIGYKMIEKAFGKIYLTAQSVDRKKLGKLVFNDVKSLKKLDNIMIPMMQNKLVQMRDTYPLSFVELAVYINYEKVFKKYFDKVILIISDKTLEKQNLKRKIGYIRKFSTNTVGNTKNPIKNRLIKSDYVVENNQDIKNLRNQIVKITKNF
ncbi:MAG: dephospho-CoA kinase [Mycoplasmataceae bacterium]|jgi:dephospho-CoA kinase|nr:dephospho-CoA kinase [Mycoplasmataceae bacterium]